MGASDGAHGGWMQWAARLAPLVLIVALAAAAIYWDLPQRLGLESLQDKRAGLVAFRDQHIILMVLGFLLFYTLVAATVPPGGFLLMLVSGFLFGFWLGGVLAVVGCTLGGLVTYQAGRTAFGQRFAGKFGKVERQLADNAFAGTLFLHIFPLVPYFVVNVAAGLAAVPIRKFIAATVLGVMPGAFAYVSIGDGAGAALDRGDGLDPALLANPQIFLPLLVLSALSGGVFAMRLWSSMRQ